MPNSTSMRLRANISLIMNLWQDKATKEIKSAKELDVLVLRDSIPTYLSQLASALETNVSRSEARISSEKKANLLVGQKHGKTRSESLNYTIDQLIFEYHLLRQIICEVLEREALLNPAEREVIVCSIEQAVNDAATEFSNRLNAQTQELKTANMELDAFSYSVSHDLRAPLRSMDGFSELLLEKHAAVLDAEAKGYLERIRTNSQKMAQLIDDLLILSRVGRTELVREKVDVSFLSNHILNRLKKLEPNRQVKTEVAVNCFAEADLGLIRVVLENLISNAWKYTSKTPNAEISVGQEGAYYFVKDNGVGFDMSHAEQLFKAFHRLHSVREYPGTGIGLATVKRIIDRHDGKILVESAPDKGTTFKFSVGESDDQ